jgi:hypothetical protein
MKAAVSPEDRLLLTASKRSDLIRNQERQRPIKVELCSVTANCSTVLRLWWQPDHCARAASEASAGG